MKITYNAPVILSLALVSVTVMAVTEFFDGSFTTDYFCLRGGMDPGDPLAYFRLFSHIVGHQDWEHLIGNMLFMLLIGPMVEEKYGSWRCLQMVGVTALVTALLNMGLFHSGLYGASGIVFMLVILASLVNFKSGEIPLTFVLVALLFMGKEVADAFKPDQTSQFAHLVGGVCGSLFGFFRFKK